MEANDSIIIVMILNLISAALQTAVDENFVLSEEATDKIVHYSILYYTIPYHTIPYHTII